MRTRNLTEKNKFFFDKILKAVPEDFPVRHKCQNTRRMTEIVWNSDDFSIRFSKVPSSENADVFFQVDSNYLHLSGSIKIDDDMQSFLQSIFSQLTKSSKNFLQQTVH